MKRTILISMVVALLAVSAPAAAQDEATLDVATLEALCEANTGDDDQLRDCLYAVHEFLIPGSGPEIPEKSEYGLRDPQLRDDVTITPLKVNWKTKPTNMFAKPGKRMKFVAVLVRYAAGEDGASFNEGDWEVTDKEGFSYDQPIIGAVPDLDSGDIRPGKKAQGWVTFEVPKNANWLEISQTGFFQDPLYWTIKR